MHWPTVSFQPADVGTSANYYCSLAVAEMKILMRDIYSTFKTTPAEGMVADMSMDDQIFTSRPKDQKCILKFTRWEDELV